MTRFERNETSIVDKRIKETRALPRVGVVDQVYEHTAPDDDTNFDVDIVFNGGVSEESRVPVYFADTGTISPPKNGDKMLVIYRNGDANEPIAFGNGSSVTDRNPVGKAGMKRSEYESDTSPAGDGNIYVTGYTNYNEKVSSTDKRELTPEESVVQVAKHPNGKNVDPITSNDTVPAKMEFFDSPKNDKSHISVEINIVDNSDSDATWGFKFDIKTGEWQIVGPSGFGIESDGSGNFTWHHKSVDFNEVDGDIGPLSL